MRKPYVFLYGRISVSTRCSPRSATHTREHKMIAPVSLYSVGGTSYRNDGTLSQTAHGAADRALAAGAITRAEHAASCKKYGHC